MNNQFGLSQNTIEAIKKVFKNYPIEKIILYGSRAKGNFKPGSDIDLTIVAPNLQLSDLLKMENELEDLDLPYKIDLSLMHQIENKSLIEHIHRVGINF